MPHEIVDQNGATAYPKGFGSESRQFDRREVMREQAATDQIECIVTEGKCERVSHDRSVFWKQVGEFQVEMRYVDRDSFARKLASRDLRHLAKSSGHFQHGEIALLRDGSDAFDHFAGCGHPPEPAIDARDVSQRGRDFGGRAIIRIEDFRRVDALHDGTASVND